MKKLLYLILYIAVLTVAGCSGGSGMKGDSSSGFSITLERAKGYTYPTDTLNLDTARQMALALLEHDSVKTDVGKRMDLLRLLTDVARMGLDYEEQVKWASQLAMLCREQGDETEALRTESEIGIVLTHLGQRWEGLAMLDKSIARLEPQRHFAELDACIIAMKRKLTALSLLPSITMPEDSVTSELRYHSIISLAERFVAKLDDYEQHPDDYADGSPQQPDSDEVAGYCDFYRSQAYVFLAQAYASTGNRKEAEKYTRMFGQSDFGQTLNGRSAITETQRLLGDYDKSRIRLLVTQRVDGDEVEAGMQVLRELYSIAKNDEREEVPVSKLRVGLKCGGSDGFSGITANPLVGEFSDWLVAQGGTSVLTEVPEMFGAETILMNRCRNEQLFQQTVSMINNFKEYFLSHGEPVGENPSPGNKAGGISTLEDKALGCTQKCGKAPVSGVMEYGDRLQNTGLNLLSAPGNDLVAATALASCGCHLVLFTTGRGTPFGTFVPTMKIATNPTLAARKPNWVDFSAGQLVEGRTMKELVPEFIDKVLSVASGEKARNEENDYREISIFKNGVTL